MSKKRKLKSKRTPTSKWGKYNIGESNRYHKTRKKLAKAKEDEKDGEEGK